MNYTGLACLLLFLRPSCPVPLRLSLQAASFLGRPLGLVPAVLDVCVGGALALDNLDACVSFAVAWDTLDALDVLDALDACVGLDTLDAYVGFAVALDALDAVDALDALDT